MDNPTSKTIGIIGLGLIGGSLALALKQATQGAQKIVAYNRKEAPLIWAKNQGIINDYCADIAQLVAQSDIIVLGVPVLTIEKILPELASAVERGVIITDVGSVKGSVVQVFQDYFGKVPACFIPVHPIAGSEYSGVQSAKCSLSTLYL